MDWAGQFQSTGKSLRPYRLPVAAGHDQAAIFRGRQILWSDELAVGGVDRLPPEDAVSTFYRNEFRHVFGKMVGLDNYIASPYYTARNGSAIKWLADSGLTGGESWLDFGAGYGLLLHQLGTLFPAIRTYAYEPSGEAQADLARVASEAFTSIAAAEARLAGAAGGSLDVISMVHVLEHACAPEQLLAQLKRWLKVGGRLLVEVPNDCERVLASDLRPVDLPHLWFFSLDGLERLLERAGFTVERAGEVGSPLAAEPAVPRLVRKLRARLTREALAKWDLGYGRAGADRDAIRVLARC